MASKLGKKGGVKKTAKRKKSQDLGKKKSSRAKSQGVVNPDCLWTKYGSKTIELPDLLD